MELTPNEEFLTPSQFLARALGKLGLATATELEPKDMARILFAFQLEQCERDRMEWLPPLGLDERKQQEVFELLVGRGSEMMTLAELLIGSSAHGADFEGIEVFLTD